ncbi:MAG: zinc metalloprotease HtpX, partial [Thermoleophilia bacterium]
MTMYEEISKNKHLSYFLIVIVTALLVLLGGAIGMATGLGWFGLVVAAAVALTLGLTSFYRGDRIVLATSRARQVTHDEEPQLFNVVE